MIFPRAFSGRFLLAGYERFAGTRKEELHVQYGGQQERAELHPVTVELAQGPNFGTITTVLTSGNLQTQYIWVGTNGERDLVNTEVHRRKHKSVERDPRVTLTTRDERNPYRYAEVRG